MLKIHILWAWYKHITKTVKIAQPVRDSVESDNLYLSLQMTLEILGHTVI